jgi:hypothetical protein
MDPIPAAPEPSAEPKRQRLIDGVRLLIGIAVAAVAAGPVFFLSGVVVSIFMSSAGAEVFGWADAETLPIILLVSIRYAFLPALLPMTLGAAAMAVLGAMFLTARSWLVWLLAGAAMAGLVCLLFPDLLGFRLVVVALVITGIACAGICRAFARWPDEDAEESA